VSIIVVTGSAGLVGSETARFYCQQGYDVFGIDNDMRSVFFGTEASTAWNRERLEKSFKNYRHFNFDIRDRDQVDALFGNHASNVAMVLHAAAQPSHDWAASEPETDFSVNAVGTLYLLEAFRRHCPEAVFIYTSTNKVYGDTPNNLPLEEQKLRYELPADHHWYTGIDETMSIDQTKHSLFGVSKAAGDLLVQEYGRYFALKTAIFRGGCLTGPAHSGTRLHGFLSYLMRCAITGKKYYIYGYKGKQVRDNIHSEDLVNAFDAFFKAPRVAEVYNIGGSRFANISMLEAIDLCERISGRKIDVQYSPENRIGDHIWWISDVSKFQSHYPSWKFEHGIEGTLREIHDVQHTLLSTG
jgi:CDP-paratose 2-epimerase